MDGGAYFRNFTVPSDRKLRLDSCLTPSREKAIFFAQPLTRKQKQRTKQISSSEWEVLRERQRPGETFLRFVHYHTYNLTFPLLHTYNCCFSRWRRIISQRLKVGRKCTGMSKPEVVGFCNPTFTFFRSLCLHSAHPSRGSFIVTSHETSFGGKVEFYRQFQSQCFDSRNADLNFYCHCYLQCLDKATF